MSRPILHRHAISGLSLLLGGAALLAQNTTTFQATSGSQATTLAVNHQAPAPPGDTDRNGLPDAWELQYFGLIGNSPAGDADNDGSTNLQEFQAGTDPTTPPFSATDTDNDGLPDAWETRYFGTLDYGPGDQFNSMDRDLLGYYQQGLVPRLYTPTVVAGLRAWYRADTGYFRDPGSGKVNLWTDLSGNGLHLRQTEAAAQPENYSSDTGEQFMFLSGAQRMAASPADVMVGATDLTVFVVLRPAPDQADNASLIALGSETSSGFDLRQLGPNANQYALVWPRAADQSPQGAAAAITAIADQSQLLTLLKGNTSQLGFLNGEPQATASVAADLSALPARLSLGGLTGGAFSGAVHEVLIYNRALSAEERETVEDDLLLRNQLNDLDRSGLPDRWERRHFGHTGVDPNADADGDGLSNRDEYVFSATPTVADSDGDGYNDGQELALGTDPADPNSKGVNQVTWLARYTTVTAAGPPEIAFWPGVTSFLGALPTFGKLEWSLTQSGAKQGNGLYRIEMELGADLTSWTIDNQIGGFNGYYGAGTFWTYLPPGLSHHTSLPFSWEGIAGFGGVRTDSVAAVNRHGGSLTATALSWTESWAYLDDNGQVRHYTNAVEMRLSRPQDPVYTVPPGQTSTGGWAPGAPAISRSAASEDSAEYHLLVPAGTTGTLRWFEVFTPADGGAKTYALQEWPIESGATKSPSHTLSCPADGTATVELLEFTGQLAVDANRDSVIQLPGEDNADLTSDANPYRFWVNDDDDGDQSRGEGEFINNVHDHEFNRFFGIRSRRDLEDFARLHINLGGLQDAIVAGTIKVGLKWKEGYSGAPAINVYLSADATGSDSYVTDATGTAASAQITGDFKNAIKDASNRVTVDTSGVFIFGPEFWAGLNAGSAKKCLLFEGDSIGLGQLVVVLLDQNGNSIGEGPGVWIDLRNIKSMYQQYRATPTSLPRPFDSLLAPYNSDQVGFEAYPGRPTFQPPSDEEQKVLVFVNGSNEPYAYSTSVAETVFKRLWWQGYKGRLASFRWETLVGPFSGEIPAHYNLNEWLAWNWGKGLRDFVASPHIPNGYTVNVAAHSLGCTLVGSALQLGMSASNVVLLQGAIPAGCFDTSGGQSEPDSINGYERMWEHEAAKPTPDNFSALGYRAFVPNVGGATIYNFYNEQDYALFFGPLDAWEGNQRINKPDGLDLFSGLAPGLSYQYNPSVSLPVSERGRLFFSATGDNRHVTTPYESMAFIARSRSKALGAKDGVGGIVNFNVNIGPGSGTDLQDARPDHSGEFTRSIQQLQDFYRILFDIIE